MLYNHYKAINKKGKEKKLYQSISPFYKKYSNVKSKKDKVKNDDSLFLDEKTTNNISNNHSFIANSLFKTTKNSPRNNQNIFMINSNKNDIQKFETSMNSPRNPFLKKVNFKAEKLNLNVKTLNMNLEINKFNNCLTNTNYNNNNDSKINNNFFIKTDNKRNEFTKFQLDNLRNQLSEIITPNYKRNDLKKNNSNKKNSNTSNSKNYSFILDKHNINHNISYSNNLTENENDKNVGIKKYKNFVLKKNDKNKKHELNIKLFNSLKNNFIGIKLPNKDKLRKNYEISRNKGKNQNEQKSKENTIINTQFDETKKEPLSNIKIKKETDHNLTESNSTEYLFKRIKIKETDKINNTQKIQSQDIKNFILDDIKDYNNKSFNNTIKNSEENNTSIIKINNEEQINKSYEELENKYSVLLHSYKIIKEENIRLSQNYNSLKDSNNILNDENKFLNNYIISLRKIINTIIMVYSEQINKLSKNMKIFSKNTKIENNNIIIKIKKILEEYYTTELQTNKKINLIIKQLINENKILRYLLLAKKPNKNDFFQEKLNLIEKDYNLNYNNIDIFDKIKKIENDYGKKLDLNFSIKNLSKEKEVKNNSVKKIDKKKSYYNEDKINKNSNEKNIKIEKKKIGYNRNKKGK